MLVLRRGFAAHGKRTVVNLNDSVQLGDVQLARPRGGFSLGAWLGKVPKSAKQKHRKIMVQDIASKRLPCKKKQFLGVVKWTFLMCLKIRNAHWWNLSPHMPGPCDVPTLQHTEGTSVSGKVRGRVPALSWCFFPSYMYSTCVIKNDSKVYIGQKNTYVDIKEIFG